MVWGFHFWGYCRGLECAEGGPWPAIGAPLGARGELAGGREDERRCLEMAESGVGKLARGSPWQRTACRRRSIGGLLLCWNRGGRKGKAGSSEAGQLDGLKLVEKSSASLGWRIRVARRRLL
jgi:hypothetical protein